MLEWINRLRTDPAGEFDRLIWSTSPVISPIPGVALAINYFGVDLSRLRAELSALTPAPPLAWNSALNDAAQSHNAAMIAADLQSHQVPGEPDLGQRIASAGYSAFTRVAENVYAYAESVAYAHAGFVIDWGPGSFGMQDPRGHRDTLMNPALREVGIALTAESNPATRVGPLVVTQNFGARANQPHAFLLGVAFQDTDRDSFYDAGEGLGGLTVRAVGTAGTFVTTTTDAGGYQMPLPPGSYTVTFAGSTLPSPVVRSITVGSQNVKLDLRQPAGDPQPPPTLVRFESSSLTITEGGVFPLVLIREGDLSATLTVRLSASFESASAADLASLPPTIVTFAAGQARATITLATSDDRLAEPAERFTVRLEPDPGYAMGSVAETVLTILDNDAPPENPPILVDARVVRALRRRVEIRLTFAGDLDSDAAGQPTAYTLHQAGRDRRFGTRDDIRLSPTRVQFDPQRRQVFLSFATVIRPREPAQIQTRPDLLRSPLRLLLIARPNRLLRAAARR
jgi:hypothetical protein